MDSVVCGDSDAIGCKACRDSREINIGRHLFRNEPWPDGAYRKDGDWIGVYVRCHHCNGDNLNGEGI